VAVGLTSKGFQSLRGAFRNTDEWKGIEGLKYYANELNIDCTSEESDISSIPSPPRKIEGSEDLYKNAQKNKDLAWERRVIDVKENFPRDMSAPVLGRSERHVRKYKPHVKTDTLDTEDGNESSTSSSPKSVAPDSSSPDSPNDGPGPHGGHQGPGSSHPGNSQGPPPSTPKGQGAKGNKDRNISSSSTGHRGQRGSSRNDGKGQRKSLLEETIGSSASEIIEAQSGEQEIPESKPTSSPVSSGHESNGKQSLSTPPTSSGGPDDGPPDRPKKLQVVKFENPSVSFAPGGAGLDIMSNGSMRGAYGSSRSDDNRTHRLGWQHSLLNIKEQGNEGSPSPIQHGRPGVGYEQAPKKGTSEIVNTKEEAAIVTIERLPADRVHIMRRTGGFEILPNGEFIQYGPFGDNYPPAAPIGNYPGLNTDSDTPRDTKELNRLSRLARSRYITHAWDDGLWSGR
jgi:hypothetical protein